MQKNAQNRENNLFSARAFTSVFTRDQKNGHSLVGCSVNELATFWEKLFLYLDVGLYHIDVLHQCPLSTASLSPFNSKI